MTLAGIDLNLLIVLDALLTERSVTKAGHKLGMSQPTTSRALSRLRILLNDPLLVRTGRGMQPTRRAEDLAPQIRTIIHLTEQALSGVPKFVPATTTRSMRVSCSDYVIQVLMKPLIKQLRTLAPNLELHLTSYNEDALRLLRNGDLDLVIEPRSLDRFAGTSSQQLFTDNWRCAMAHDSPHANGSFDLADFAAAPHLTYTLGVAHGPNLADRAFQRHGITVRPSVTTESFALVPTMLRGTDLVSLVLEHMMADIELSNGIVLRQPPIELPQLVQTMYWSPRNDDDLSHQWFRSAVIDVANAIGKT